MSDAISDLRETFREFLRERTAVVTGASRGIGQAIAVSFARLGADVALVQRGDAAETAAAIEELGCRAVVVQADLARAGEAEAAVDEARAVLGRLDIAVCNAALNVRGAALEVSLDDLRAVLEVTAVSAFATSRATARAFVEQGGGGHIVHVSSAYAFFGGIQVAPYAGAKGAITQIMKSEAIEWAPHGIRVNAVAPGWVETVFTKALRDNESRYRDITDRILLGRWASPQEIANAVAFLVSPAAGYLQGHVLVADGGYAVR